MERLRSCHDLTSISCGGQGAVWHEGFVMLLGVEASLECSNTVAAEVGRLKLCARGSGRQKDALGPTLLRAAAACIKG
jgi:hypothetical protein